MTTTGPSFGDNPSLRELVVDKSTPPLPSSVLPPSIFERPDETHTYLSHSYHVDGNEVAIDIYRASPGDPIVPSLGPRVTTVRSSSSSSSSSSASSLGVGRRLGALAATVELAITRWARRNWSDDSSSSSSSSGSSRSLGTITRPQLGRRNRRRLSTTTLNTIDSERVIIARKKAREEFRVVPREFVLYLPRPSSPVTPNDAFNPEQVEQCILRTPSLPLILAQLDTALKKSAKFRRVQKGMEQPLYLPESGVQQHRHRHRDRDFSTESTPKKGKHKSTGRERMARVEHSLDPVDHPPARSSHHVWWLDVSSPTWEDMRALGKLLHLHPLTLEDILQQEPREKLEIFPKLGYYFVVFRALEGKKSRQRFQGMQPRADLFVSPEDEGVIGAVNVYLVVFREGICSFHFEDISEHADKVRSKLLQLEQTIQMSPDWIAHGIMDSIVDAFFPILTAIEREVEDVEKLVLSNPETIDEHLEEHTSPLITPLQPGLEVSEKNSENTLSGSSPKALESIQTKYSPSRRRMTHFSIPLSPGLWIRKLRRSRSKFHQRLANIGTESLLSRSTADGGKLPTTRARTLLRMTATRRLVTSLSRLLISKSEVVAQIRKRLLSGADWDEAMGDSGEVVIHFGDVQDHIFTLQQSLAHYERMLSHSHPAYLSQLRMSLSQAKGGTDKALFFLTIVSLSVICIQTLIGLFSINAHKIPTNSHSGDKYTVFLVILALAVIILASFLLLVRYWWMQAKKKYGRNLSKL